MQGKDKRSGELSRTWIWRGVSDQPLRAIRTVVLLAERKAAGDLRTPLRAALLDFLKVALIGPAAMVTGGSGGAAAAGVDARSVWMSTPQGFPYMLES